MDRKSKGRQELHSGLLWIQTIFHLRFFFLASTEADFTLFPRLRLILVSAAKSRRRRQVGERAKWRSEKLRCPCFNDK